MDLDAFIAVHGPDWQRLDRLARRRRLTGAEVDEMVLLYQRAGTHLSVLRSGSGDPQAVARLSMTVARARGAVQAADRPVSSGLTRFFTVSFPVAVYRARVPSAVAAAVTVLVAVVSATWMLHDPAAMASLGSDADLQQYAAHDFGAYYSEHAASSFAFRVWTNNAWVTAQCVLYGITGVMTCYVVWVNALNLGVAAAIMHHYGYGLEFYTYILPHGLLELTCVFVAAGAGVRLCWAWVRPGPDTRAQALAREGRSMFTVALGLVVVLFVSGILEGFLTPSPLPAWARIGLGAAVWLAFLAYVGVFGARALRAGETGDLERELVGDVRPVLVER